MNTYINVEGVERAASRLESAASEATRAADRLDEAIHQLTLLIGAGYGNVAESLLHALERQEEQATPATPNHLRGVTEMAAPAKHPDTEESK